MILRLAPTRLPVLPGRRPLQDRAVVGLLGLERERRHVLARGQALDEQHDRQPPVVAMPVEKAAGAAATSAAISTAARRATTNAAASATAAATSDATTDNASSSFFIPAATFSGVELSQPMKISVSFLTQLVSHVSASCS